MSLLSIKKNSRIVLVHLILLGFCCWAARRPFFAPCLPSGDRVDQVCLKERPREWGKTWFPGQVWSSRRLLANPKRAMQNNRLVVRAVAFEGFRMSRTVLFSRSAVCRRLPASSSATCPGLLINPHKVDHQQISFLLVLHAHQTRSQF